jgi:hypothetical protein
MVLSCHPRRAHNLQSLYVLRLFPRSSASSPSSPSSALGKARCSRLGVSRLAPCQCPLPSLCFQQLPTIKLNYPTRIVHPERSEGSLCKREVGAHPNPFRLYSFQQLTTVKFCNHFVLITIRIARGVVYPLRASSANLPIWNWAKNKCPPPGHAIANSGEPPGMSRPCDCCADRRLP